MTVTIPLEVSVPVGIFLICSFWGLAVSIKDDNFRSLVAGVLLGAMFGGAIGVGMHFDKKEQQRRDAARSQKIEQIQAEQEQRAAAIEALPPKWRQFREKLADISDIPMKQIYVERFLESKTPPKMTKANFQTIYTDDGVYYETAWDVWLTEKLMPFVVDK